MAPYTYYYFFSIILLLGVVDYLATITRARLKGKTLSGVEFKPGTAGYERMKKLTSARGLAVPLIIGALLCVNLAYSLSLVARLGTRDAHFVLFFAPVACILLMIGALRTTRKNLNGKSSGRHGS